MLHEDVAAGKLGCDRWKRNVRLFEREKRERWCWCEVLAVFRWWQKKVIRRRRRRRRSRSTFRGRCGQIFASFLCRWNFRRSFRNRASGEFSAVWLNNLCPAFLSRVTFKDEQILIVPFADFANGTCRFCCCRCCCRCCPPLRPHPKHELRRCFTPPEASLFSLFIFFFWATKN